MNEITKGVLVGVATAVILSGVGYLLLAKENKVRIDMLLNEVQSVSRRVDRGNESLTALKLFVVSAHPDRDHMTLSSAQKVQQLTGQELGMLAGQMDRFKTAAAFATIAREGSPQISAILQKHQIDSNDLVNLWASVENFEPNAVDGH